MLVVAAAHEEGGVVEPEDELVCRRLQGRSAPSPSPSP
jgi:hypothetical protein